MNLYVTDLDGTLLNSEQRLSDNTVKIINELIDQGMNFSIATARSCQSAAVVLEKLNLKLPVILTNGVYVYDTLKKENLVFNSMDSTMAYEIVNRAKKRGLSPIVITKDKESGKIYYRGVFNPGEEDYIQDRINNNDRRLRLVDEIPDVRCETVVTVVFIDEDKKIAPFYEELRSKYDLMYHYGEDIYTKYYWLEITHRDSDKGRGALFLKDYVGADKLICFGDHMNDISMFKMADEAYAVGNAVQELKNIASGVIGDNDSDGVARYLQEALRDG